MMRRSKLRGLGCHGSGLPVLNRLCLLAVSELFSLQCHAKVLCKFSALRLQAGLPHSRSPRKWPVDHQGTAGANKGCGPHEEEPGAGAGQAGGMVHSMRAGQSMQQPTNLSAATPPQQPSPHASTATEHHPTPACGGNAKGHSLGLNSSSSVPASSFLPSMMKGVMARAMTATVASLPTELVKMLLWPARGGGGWGAGMGSDSEHRSSRHCRQGHHLHKMLHQPDGEEGALHSCVLSIHPPTRTHARAHTYTHTDGATHRGPPGASSGTQWGPGPARLPGTQSPEGRPWRGGRS